MPTFYYAQLVIARSRCHGSRKISCFDFFFKKTSCVLDVARSFWWRSRCPYRVAAAAAVATAAAKPADSDVCSVDLHDVGRVEGERDVHRARRPGEQKLGRRSQTAQPGKNVFFSPWKEPGKMLRKSVRFEKVRWNWESLVLFGEKVKSYFKG